MASFVVTNRPSKAEGLGDEMQPIVIAEDGVIRFKENKIVRYLIDFSREHGCSLNELAQMDFSQEDFMQLAQLIGYSVSGFGDLSYADPKVVKRADKIAEKLLISIKDAK